MIDYKAKKRTRQSISEPVSIRNLILNSFFLRYIKLSSPKLNNVMVLGAMHIHISILLFDLDEWFLDRNFLGYACMVNSM